MALTLSHSPVSPGVVSGLASSESPAPGEAEPGGGLVSAAAFPSSAGEVLTFRVGISSGSEPARGKKPQSRSVLPPPRENWDAHGGQGGSRGGEHRSGIHPRAPLSFSVKWESQSGCDEPMYALYEHLCDCFPADVPGERERMGPGQGALGKVGQDAELIFLPLPQGHPSLINCWSWSLVRLAQAPPGPGVFLTGTAEEPRIASSCVRSERTRRPRTEPEVGSPASARSGCKRPRDPLPLCSSVAPRRPDGALTTALPCGGAASCRWSR